METAPVKERSKNVFRKSTRKAPAIKKAVVARRLIGQSFTQIATDLKIGINTARSISALSDVDSMLENGRLGTLQRIPQALKTLDVRLEKNSESAALYVLDKCFENQKVTGNRMSGDVTLNKSIS